MHPFANVGALHHVYTSKNVVPVQHVYTSKNVVPVQDVYTSKNAVAVLHVHGLKNEGAVQHTPLDVGHNASSTPQVRALQLYEQSRMRPGMLTPHKASNTSQRHLTLRL